ncbi:hypothetical protein DSM104299_02048 [Baekduia alba]|uniref:hypothetical protein n=1 Tax=Baekduia alba TaxID=2997333 RepID=UPI0023401306|nr:hypothetical protein [Baekduia alba]WCB93335.1 hypothetical protein DSM104299_02048 [Baekduia alba]
MKQTDQKPPAALSPGDLVEFEGEIYEVLGRPFLGRSGASVFDEFVVFWRVRLRSLRDPAHTCCGTWPAGQDAIVAS